MVRNLHSQAKAGGDLCNHPLWTYQARISTVRASSQQPLNRETSMCIEEHQKRCQNHSGSFHSGTWS